MTTTLRRVLVCLVCLCGIFVTRVSAQTPAVPSDKLGWDVKQDTTGMTFAVKVDGVRSNLTAICDAPVNGIALCKAPLPAMTVGTHAIEVIAIVNDGPLTAESGPSLPLSVRFIAVVTPENVRLIRG